MHCDIYKCVYVYVCNEKKSFIKFIYSSTKSYVYQSIGIKFDITFVIFFTLQKVPKRNIHIFNSCTDISSEKCNSFIVSNHVFKVLNQKYRDLRYIYIRVIQNNLMSLKGHIPEGILKRLSRLPTCLSYNHAF